MITKTEKQVAAFFAILVALAAIAWFAVEPAYATEDKKVTICHATSSETNPFVTITVSENAVYGPGGHFNENGTTQAGHEQDYFGECETEEPPVDPCPNGDLNGDAEGCDAIVVPPPPPPRVCPDGLPPTPGEGAFDPNDDCKRPPVKEETTSTPTETTPVTPVPPVSPEPPSPSAPEAPAAPSAETPEAVTPEILEEEAEKQAKKNGATSSPPSGNQTPATELPYTGLPLGLMALLGMALTGTGAWLRRRA